MIGAGTSHKKKLGSYPSLSSVFSITLALFAIGVFGALVIYSKELEKIIKETVRVQIYLNHKITPEVKLKIEKELYAKNIVSQSKNAIQFISKEEAEKQFISETGENFKEFLGENPLRDAYLVRISEEWQSKEKLALLKNDIEKIPGVFQVYYKENLIESINQNITRIGLVIMSMVALLLIVVVLLINNTLRLALYSQRFIIRSMQLVGAKKWFIQRPFLFRASLHGMLSGVLASALLIGLLAYASQRIEELKLIQNNERLLLLMASLLLVGIIVAVVSSYLAVNKYLKLSLDELY
ncbi:MAG: Cell-division-associated, ABC-transporter-like signaling protein FtsX [Cytophagales bacterium]|jgi:cell division transport system permease protein|nr:ABC transporter permease [Bacteroidota bacterium]MBS1981640.1 ABC transporter permease [Bacteroidota bacterium]WHZ08950.1 MAG: Cell-division-associated, ABC-transporter-like signaling protein FtsX [Cytophagales bacterium]